MKIDIFDLEGKSVEKIDLPAAFKEPIREDLIIRAVLASQSNRRQPYGTDILAGKRSSAHYHGKRRSKDRYGMMSIEMARMPRLHAKTVPHMSFTARIVPQSTKGRVAHPPKVEKIWELKINRKERKQAIQSAIAATAIRDLVLKRGHIVNDISIPIVVEDKIQELKKTKDVINFLKKVGLEKELERIEERKIRAGKGKTRGRRYKIKIGPLFIITQDKGIGKAIDNIPGCNVCRVENLSAEYLAPGAMPGRLTIWTKSAVEKLGE
jgi:large subunit ribosomal protein L4e